MADSAFEAPIKFYRTSHSFLKTILHFAERPRHVFLVGQSNHNFRDPTSHLPTPSRVVVVAKIHAASSGSTLRKRYVAQS
jgi:hypothetical protein